MSVTPQEQLQSATQAMATAAFVLRMEMPTMEAFLKECRDMENFGSIVHPTLYRNSERRAVSAVVKPLFEASIAFVQAYDEHTKKAADALAKVSGEPAR